MDTDIDLSEMRHDSITVEDHECIVGVSWSCDRYGNEFETLTASGVKRAGEAFTGYFSSEEVAMAAYIQQLSAYTQAAHTVVWRSRPEVIEIKDVFLRDKSFDSGKEQDYEPVTFYQVYSRLTAIG